MKPKDFRYINFQDKFLEYSYLALSDHFASRNDFNAYFDGIETGERKNLFLRTASFYLFLVKRGTWEVDVPGSNKTIDYLTDTYKYIAIFSLIESLSESRFMDFYDYLLRRKSEVAFPIRKEAFEEHYTKYKQKYGSVRRCVSFFAALSDETKEELISKLEVKGTERNIENFAKHLYEMRSKFIHEADLVLHMSEHTSIGLRGNKPVVCSLSIKDAMRFFEKGLLAHFGAKAG